QRLDRHRSRRDLRPERHDVRSACVLHEHHFEDALGRMEPWTECRTERGQRRERHQEFDRCGKPQRVANRGMVPSQEQRRQPDDGGKQGRLPQVRDDVRKGNHHRRRSLSARAVRPRRTAEAALLCRVAERPDRAEAESLRSARSASCTSFSVSLPASIKWAITGCVRPPKMLSNSWSSRRSALSREICASKISALPTFLTRRTACLASRRYTMVWTVV